MGTCQSSTKATQIDSPSGEDWRRGPSLRLTQSGNLNNNRTSYEIPEGYQYVDYRIIDNSIGKEHQYVVTVVMAESKVQLENEYKRHNNQTSSANAGVQAGCFDSFELVTIDADGAVSNQSGTAEAQVVSQSYKHCSVIVSGSVGPSGGICAANPILDITVMVRVAKKEDDISSTGFFETNKEDDISSTGVFKTNKAEDNPRDTLGEEIIAVSLRNVNQSKEVDEDLSEEFFKAETAMEYAEVHPIVSLEKDVEIAKPFQSAFQSMKKSMKQSSMALLKPKVTPSSSGFSDAQLREILEYIDKGNDERMSFEKTSLDALFVMGNSGCGKSTTINFLVGCKMTMKEEGLKSYVEVDENSQIPGIAKIGHTNESETRLPQVHCLESFALCDTPGFLENRGPIVNIANAVNTVAMAKAAACLKFLFLLPYNDLLETREHNVDEVFKVLDVFFGGNEALCASSRAILVGVTKIQKDFTWDDKHVSLVKSEVQEWGRKRGWDLLEGNILLIDPLEQNERFSRDVLVKSINDLDSLRKGELEFNVSLSDQDKLFLQKISKYFVDKISNCVEEEKYKDILDFYQKLDSLSCIGEDESLSAGIENFKKDIKSKVTDARNAATTSALEDRKKEVKSALLKLENFCILDGCFSKDEYSISEMFVSTKEQVRRIEQKQQEDRNADFKHNFKVYEERIREELRTMLEHDAPNLAKMEGLNSDDWFQRQLNLGQINVFVEVNRLCQSLIEEEKYREEVYYFGNQCAIQPLQYDAMQKIQKLLVDSQKLANKKWRIDEFDQVWDLVKQRKQEIIDAEFDKLPETDAALSYISRITVIEQEQIDTKLQRLEAIDSKKWEEYQHKVEEFEQQIREELARKFKTKMIDQILCNIRAILPDDRFLDIDLCAQLNRLKQLEEKANTRNYSQIRHDLEQHIFSFQKEGDLKKMIQKGDTAEFTSRYAIMRTLKPKIQPHIEVDISVFEIIVENHLEMLKMQALEEIHKQPHEFDFLNFNELKGFFAFLQGFRDDECIDKRKEQHWKSDLKSATKEVWNEVERAIKKLPQERWIHTDIMLISKRILKSYGMSLELSIQDEFGDFLHKCLSRIDGALVDELGTCMSEMVEDPYVGVAAQTVLDIFPEFRKFMYQRFNKKAKGVTFERALSRMRTQPEITENGKSLLRQLHERIREQYGRHVNDIVSKRGNASYDEQTLQNIINSESKTLKGKQRFHDSASQVAVASVLAALFAYWTYKKSAIEFYSGDTDYLCQPHDTQILAILRLIGMDDGNQRGSLPNHVAEILTGEGKSLVLAILSAFYAKLGFTSHVVCYSPYLCYRDKKAFADFRKGLGIDSNVSYKTIGDLCEFALNNLMPNTREKVRSFLKGENPRKWKETVKEKHVLLIDEVDVFFGQDFYGQVYWPAITLQSESIISLYKFIWSRRSGTLPDFNEIMNQPFTTQIIQEYPNLRSLLEHEIIPEMLENVTYFPVNERPWHSYEVAQNGSGQLDIGYKDAATNSIAFNSRHGHLTSFAYLHECDTGRISDDWAREQIGIVVGCGGILYSKLPLFFHRILAMTGTLEGLSEEENGILAKYKLTTKTYIPSTFEKQQCHIHDIQVIGGNRNAEYFDSIKGEIKEMVIKGRACLVVFETDEIMEEFQKQLKNKPIKDVTKFNQPNTLGLHMQSQERDSFILRAATPFQVTLMTRSYGRGTDFICRDSNLPAKGGVHVILTFFPTMKTEEIQIKGRTCRQDDPGSFRYILLEDDLSIAGYIGQTNANGVDVSDASELRNAENEVSYLEDKRKEMDTKRFDEMQECLTENEKYHENTLSMIQMIDQRKPAVEVIQVLMSFKV